MHDHGAAAVLVASRSRRWLSAAASRLESAEVADETTIAEMATPMSMTVSEKSTCIHVSGFTSIGTMPVSSPAAQYSA